MRTQGEGSIYPLPNGKWVAMISTLDGDGKRVRRSKTSHSRKGAESALRELKAAFRGVGSQAVAKTVSELLEAWLAFKSSEISAPTGEQYRYAVRHLKNGLGSVSLSKLRPQQIDQFLQSKHDLSPRYRKLLRTVLSMALDQGVRWQLLASNPAAYSAKIKQPEAEGRGLTDQQARSLLEAAHGDRLEALWVVMLLLGLRRGEALGLQWDDYDRHRRILTVTRQLRKDGTIGELKTKGSKRSIPVPVAVTDALETHRSRQLSEIANLAAEGIQWRNQGVIFTTGIGSYLNPDNASHYFKALAKRAGLDDWHLHELRHSAASFMLVKGVPLEVVADILGHSSIRITADIYGHLTSERLKVGADAMDAVFSGLTDKSANIGQIVTI